MWNFTLNRAIRTVCYAAGTAAIVVGVAGCAGTSTGGVQNGAELTAIAQNGGQPDAQATSKDYVVIWNLFGTPTPRPTLDKIDSVTATAAAANAPTAVVAANGTKPTAAPLQAGDADRGQQIFTSIGTCTSCHDVQNGVTIVGPSLKGVASRAGTRKPGMSADAYLHESILNPTAFVVEGFQPVMPQNFSSVLTPQQIEDLVAYLKTLK